MKTEHQIKKRLKQLDKNIADLRSKQEKAPQKEVYAWEMQIDMFRMAKEQIEWVLNT
ncbi:hypothetical protein ACGK9U_08920 [Mariniflexile sp. HNIBRBA6329]|uniref:hypothetical protein n=1 Tax=Mariniflexile sp. HNIBRBA6329 TaxID=3373088 RepID=UPI0037460959